MENPYKDNTGINLKVSGLQGFRINTFSTVKILVHIEKKASLVVQHNAINPIPPQKVHPIQNGGGLSCNGQLIENGLISFFGAHAPENPSWNNFLDSL